MISSLYMKDSYLNRNVELLTNENIIEYDLKSANTSLCREYEIIPIKEIERLEKMDKKKRVVTFGKMMRADKSLADKLKDAFIDIRKRFFEANDIQDGDVLAIKKDAIFCLKEMHFTEFGHCRFVKKNAYTSFMRVGNLELYYAATFSETNPDGTLDVKGIADEALDKHDPYMMSFLRTLFKHLELSEKGVQAKYLTRFVTRYKHCKLDLGYYREFNHASVFRVLDSETTYDEKVFLPEHPFESLDISYNFSTVILPIVRILL